MSQRLPPKLHGMQGRLHEHVDGYCTAFRTIMHSYFSIGVETVPAKTDTAKADVKFSKAAQAILQDWKIVVSHLPHTKPDPPLFRGLRTADDVHALMQRIAFSEAPQDANGRTETVADEPVFGDFDDYQAKVKGRIDDVFRRIAAEKAGRLLAAKIAKLPSPKELAQDMDAQRHVSDLQSYSYWAARGRVNKDALRRRLERMRRDVRDRESKSGHIAFIWVGNRKVLGYTCSVVLPHVNELRETKKLKPLTKL